MSEQVNLGFLDRALRNLRSAWQGIAGVKYDAAAASLRPDLPDEDAARLREQMRACLETRGGEVSARARAAALGHAYLALDAVGRERFLKVLAEDFDVDHEAVDTAAEALRQADGATVARQEAEKNLRAALWAPRVKLLTQFNSLPEGVKFLVDMRAELIPMARRDPLLKALESDLKFRLTMWFDVDFLELKRITWDGTPAEVLEKLIAYEAVHAITSWDDLKNRLASDRRCFAYFHPRMPDEPLIFVEVALVDGMADSIQDLLDEKAPVLDPASADTAIFYSISNAQKGLAGISFGGFLIKRVADSLAGEFPGLKNFATLSPIPGFRTWLDGVLKNGEAGLLLPSEHKTLKSAAGGLGGAKGTLKGLLEGVDQGAKGAIGKIPCGPLMRLCARYLLQEKREDGAALDPVAHFHLSNGARMERLNWRGDRSPKGMAQSAGIMINYLYKLDDIGENHEAYTSEGEIVASSAVRGLLKG
ncbi:MAG: malonyl-CoA decarboxylase [Rhodospirillales bacterium]|jgi:malonyl-CoA decarboxylase|nr:malonyl-CoA decarboxylase [Rhodospirillales bacterium]MDP6774130.1 malonyl-CoA decarboxylase [Rhodospirillales bacterium]